MAENENRNLFNINYNELNNAPNLPYNIISKLMSENEDLWKLLKYNENNALSQSNLTQQEKRDLIYNGGQNASNYKVFTNILVPDESFNEVQSQLRVAIDAEYPNNNMYSDIEIVIQILCHSDNDTLDNYQSRAFRMVGEVKKSINGMEIGGIGKITMNRSKNIQDGTKFFKFNKYFSGYIMKMSVNST